MYKNLLKQTAIYGLATVLPRMLSFLLVRLYTDTLPKAEYGELSVIMSWMVFLNVILSYGFETAFFRFTHKESDKSKVISTSMISIFWTSLLFLGGALLLRSNIAQWVGVQEIYITYAIWILVLDALVLIPFSKLRANQRPMFYAAVKIGNVVLYLLLNLFFLLILPNWAKTSAFWNNMYEPGFEVGYIFISNLIASLLTLVVLCPDYFRISWHLDFALWKKMMRYGIPILFAGIAFAINEHFDKIVLEKLLPANIAKAQVGVYAACYKLALFMTLYATAFRLGIEPFFFSLANTDNAQQTYANITRYFVIFGSIILLGVVVFVDLLKMILLDNPDYWSAMNAVPLIIVANFFLGIYTNLSFWYKLIDKTSIGAWISFLGAALTLILNFTLIPYFQNHYGMGYLGSAIATIAAYGSMMFVSFYLGQKYYPIPYDFKRIGSYLAASIGFSFLSFYVFRENYWIGIGLLLLFFGMTYYFEKDGLQHLLKRKKA